MLAALFSPLLGGENSSSKIPYSQPFGNNPYAPSQAQGEFQSFLKPSDFPPAGYCAKCHADAYHQWRQSAHANSFRAPFYLNNVQMLIDEKGIALRGLFVIDPEGVLRYKVVHDLNIGRSAEETLRVIQALQTGGLCQAEWRPGQETIKT